MFKLPELGYDFAALEPHIDAATMEIHHDKHHAAYVEKLNEALKNNPGLQGKTIEELLADLDKSPEDIRTIICNNGGGHHNHSLFWEVMKPGGAREPSDKLAEIFINTFGGFEDFKAKMGEVAVGRFGSGWAWLVRQPASGKLDIYSTANQDSPLTEGKTPILGLDVWEHAYYLKYQNRRSDYVTAWWNVVNWDVVRRRLV